MRPNNIFYDNRTNRVYVRRNNVPNGRNNIPSNMPNNIPQTVYPNMRNNQINRNGSNNQNNQNNNSNNNDLDANQLLEVNVKEFFEKFGSQFTPNVVEGPRGFPGMVGPQGPEGPPGKGIDEDLLQTLNAIVKDYSKPKHLQKNQIHTLLFGIKKTNIVENNHTSLSSSNYFKIMKNNIDMNDIIYDSFYLSPNILEINDYSHFNYVHERKVEKFQNNNDYNDYQYFPLEYIPSGFPIQLNGHVSNIIIQNYFI